VDEATGQQCTARTGSVQKPNPVALRKYCRLSRPITEIQRKQPGRILQDRRMFANVGAALHDPHCQRQLTGQAALRRQCHGNPALAKCLTEL